VFAAYVTARAHALFDFRLYLPKQWCQTRSVLISRMPFPEKTSSNAAVNLLSRFAGRLGVRARLDAR
jgi:hypothetical protein